MPGPIPITRIAGPPTGGPVAFTFGTLMSRADQYDQFRASFEKAGFTTADCEYLAIDNSAGNVGDGYRGLNAILAEARAETVILCHQDIVAIDDRRALEARLAELTAHDPLWAAAGNAGGGRVGEVFLRITDGHGEQRHGVFPQRVSSLDENFIIVHRSTRVGFSDDLAGFHLYGTDLCMIAEILGHSAYVIDFHLHHLGQGNAGPDFYECRENFRRKWQRVLRPRGLQTPITWLYLTGNPLVSWLTRPFERRYFKLNKRQARRRIRATTAATNVVPE